MKVSSQDRKMISYILFVDQPNDIYFLIPIENPGWEMLYLFARALTLAVAEGQCRDLIWRLGCMYLKFISIKQQHSLKLGTSLVSVSGTDGVMENTKIVS